MRRSASEVIRNLERRIARLEGMSRTASLRQQVLISTPTTTTQLYKKVDESVWKKIIRGLRDLGVESKSVVINRLVGEGDNINTNRQYRYFRYELTLSIPSKNVENVHIHWGPQGVETKVIFEGTSYRTGRGGARGIIDALEEIIESKDDGLSAYVSKMNKYYSNNPFAWD